MRLSFTLWDSLKIYLVNDRKLSDKKASLLAVKSRLKKLCSFFFNVDFTRENFNLFINQMREKNYAPSHVNNMIKIGKHVDKFLKLNFIQDYTYFNEKRMISVDVLSPSEIESLANVAIPYKKKTDVINQRQKVLIYLLGTTGARIGELLSLKWIDIHTSPPALIFRDTKSNNDRIVPIGDKIYRMILELPRREETVFTSSRGGILDLQQVNLDLKTRSRAIGLKKNVYAHLFRHSYITAMLEEGIDWLDLSVIVGHKDPKTTLRYKHSLIGHYADLIYNHPLLKKSISWETLVKKIKNQLSRSVDTSSFSLKIEEKEEKLTIEVGRGKEKAALKRTASSYPLLS